MILAAMPHAARAADGSVDPISIGVVEQPLTIGARSEVLSDFNVVEGPTQAAVQRGLSKAEIIVTPSALLNYGHSNGRVGFTFDGVFGYDFHQTNTVLDRERIDASTSATALIGASCSATGRFAYQRKQTRQQDLTLIVTGNTVKIDIATLAQTCILPSGLIESVQVLSSGWHNSSLLNINNNRQAVSGLLGYASPGGGRLGVTFLYEKTDFFGRPAIMVMTPDTLTKTSVGLQFNTPNGRRFSTTLSAGYVFSQARVAPLSLMAGPHDRQGVVAQGEAVYRPVERLRITALAARRIRHDTSFTITTDAQLGLDYTLSPAIHASIGGRWLRDVYYGRALSLAQIAQDRQDQTTAYATINVRIAPHSYIAADIRHDVGRSDFALFDYTGNRLTLTLSTSFVDPFHVR